MPGGYRCGILTWFCCGFVTTTATTRTDSPSGCPERSSLFRGVQSSRPIEVAQSRRAGSCLTSFLSKGRPTRHCVAALLQLISAYWLLLTGCRLKKILPIRLTWTGCESSGLTPPFQEGRQEPTALKIFVDRKIVGTSRFLAYSRVSSSRRWLGIAPMFFEFRVVREAKENTQKRP
jgi:hypothetical protein